MVAHWPARITDAGGLRFQFEHATTFTSDAELPVGDVEVGFDFACESTTPGGPATVRLIVDGKDAGGGRVAEQVRARFGVECIDVGVDSLSPVDDAYRDRNGYRFTGRIGRVDIAFEGAARDLTPAETFSQHLAMD